jgi:hypothetical protein
VTKKSSRQQRGKTVGRIFKALIYLAIIGFIGLVGYAYIGPFFGVDFSAPQTEMRVPVTLDAN